MLIMFLKLTCCLNVLVAGRSISNLSLNQFLYQKHLLLLWWLSISSSFFSSLGANGAGDVIRSSAMLINSILQILFMSLKPDPYHEFFLL